MDIRLVRIDDRLIHGQVATVWTKHSKINRILVVSDDVAQDALRKTLLIQAAPPNIVVNVIPVKKMIEVYHDPRFNDSIKAMLLFTNPSDVKKVVEAGVKIKTLNVGGMSYQTGKHMITNAVAIDDKDEEAFVFLSNQGIAIDIRKVVSDSPVDLIHLLKKNHLKTDQKKTI